MGLEPIEQAKFKELDKSSAWMKMAMSTHFLNELRTIIIDLTGKIQNHNIGELQKQIKLALTAPSEPLKRHQRV